MSIANNDIEDRTLDQGVSWHLIFQNMQSWERSNPVRVFLKSSKLVLLVVLSIISYIKLEI